jgi:hypothetical protein
MFILIVLFMPKGIVGLPTQLRHYWNHWRHHRHPAPEDDAEDAAKLTTKPTSAE